MRNLLTMAVLLLPLGFGWLLPTPMGDLPPVHAQSDFAHLYIEPGTTMLRDPDTGGQIQGKVVIDLRTGSVWGFPTATPAPYPVVLSRREPPPPRRRPVRSCFMTSLLRQPAPV